MAGRSPLTILRDQPEPPPAPSPEKAAERDEAPLAADPKPKRTRGTAKASATTVKRISTELTVGLKFLAGAWSLRDTHCGPVLNRHAKAIADEVAEILAEDPTVAAWFEQATGFSKWVKLAMAVAPVLEAIYAHHVTHEVSRETEDEGSADGIPGVEDLPAFHPGQRYGAA